MQVVWFMADIMADNDKSGLALSFTGMGGCSFSKMDPCRTLAWINETWIIQHKLCESLRMGASNIALLLLNKFF